MRADEKLFSSHRYLCNWCRVQSLRDDDVCHALPMHFSEIYFSATAITAVLCPHAETITASFIEYSKINTFFMYASLCISGFSNCGKIDLRLMTRRKICYALMLCVKLLTLAEKSLEIDVLIWGKAASLH